jgi:uncharacterized protein YdiU (UPF0061 family)
MTTETAASGGPVAFRFDNSYARLPDRFYARHAPTPVAAPRLMKLNQPLARELGLDPAQLVTPEGVEILAGNRVPEGAEPLAQAYAGHQFGHFVPQLGDGRAILLGEVVDRSGVRRDVQLKGSGPTPFSRRGDGRAAVGPVLREYIVSEAFHALGIPATRSLAAVATGQPVARETMLPGAVLTRVAASHVRVGTFQYFAARQDWDAIRKLVGYVIERHYPDAPAGENASLALLDAVISRQARLVARWMGVGFIHGVMNTDNMSIAGETIDFGPCAFMDHYDPMKVFSSIDHHGRYAFANQPRIAAWNLARFTETLLAVLDEDQNKALPMGQTALDRFVPQFEAAYLEVLRAKLGLTTPEDGDRELANGLLDAMAQNGADYTGVWRRLSDVAGGGQAAEARLREQFMSTAQIDVWLPRWRERLARESDTSPETRTAAMRAVNPAFIPRNHLVEEALTAAEAGDMGPFEMLIGVLSRPYDDQPGRERYALPPRPEEVVHQTFCGT